MSERGGPQLIPRPPGATQGDPAPWSFLPAEQRVVTADRLREVFTGRVGKSSIVEAEETVRPSAVLAPFYELDGELHVVLDPPVVGPAVAHRRGELSRRTGRRGRVRP